MILFIVQVEQQSPSISIIAMIDVGFGGKFRGNHGNISTHQKDCLEVKVVEFDSFGFVVDAAASSFGVGRSSDSAFAEVAAPALVAAVEIVPPSEVVVVVASSEGQEFAHASEVASFEKQNLVQAFVLALEVAVSSVLCY